MSAPRYVIIGYYDPQRGGSYTRTERQFYDGREPEGMSRLWVESAVVAKMEKALEYVRDHHHEGDGEFDRIVNAALVYE